MDIERGYRGKISDIADETSTFCVRMTTEGGAVYDSCCFGVDREGKLSDDRYMVFYNQPESPGKEIRFSSSGNTAEYMVSLSMLPDSIEKLVFTVSIDGNGTMRNISSHIIEIVQNGETKARTSLSGSDFENEKAIIGLEIYKKSVWRFGVVARGFDGGLADLLRSFGGELLEDAEPAAQKISEAEIHQTPPPAQTVPLMSSPTVTEMHQTPPPAQTVPLMSSPTVTEMHQTPPPAQNAPIMSSQTAAHVQPDPLSQTISRPEIPSMQQSVSSSGSGINEPVYRNSVSVSEESKIAEKLMKKISLEKDKVNLEKHVVNLSKCVVDLSKKNGVDLGNTRAKVVVALDYSGSMNRLYNDGTVQRTINRLVPLGLTFDDNGSIDMYLFQSDYRKMPDLDLMNYENYVSSVIRTSGYTMGGTNYSPVLRAIIDGDTYRVGGFLGIGGRRVVSEAIVDDYMPTFILFITDGENADRSTAFETIKRSSEKNVFIQFIGIGNERFSFLMQLDDIPGRRRDNTGFSKMADLDNADDSVLYTNVLEQFSGWLRGLQ